MNNNIQLGWNTDFTIFPNTIWEVEELEQDHILVFIYLSKLETSPSNSYPNSLDIAKKCKIRDEKGNISILKAENAIDKLISIGLLQYSSK